MTPLFIMRFFIFEIYLDRPGELDGQRIAVAIFGRAGFDADPTFADAIFGDVGLLDAFETHADVALEHLGVVIGALRIGRQAVRRGFGHGVSVQSIDSPAALSGAPFFSISGPIMRSRYSVERCSGDTTNEPVATSCCCTAGVSIAVTVASCSFLMIEAGVPLG